MDTENKVTFWINSDFIRIDGSNVISLCEEDASISNIDDCIIYSIGMRYFNLPDIVTYCGPSNRKLMSVDHFVKNVKDALVMTFAFCNGQTLLRDNTECISTNNRIFIARTILSKDSLPSIITETISGYYNDQDLKLISLIPTSFLM